MNQVYIFPSVASITRNNSCPVCDNQKGALVGQINYIGLEQYNMVQCATCGLVSCDPLPSAEVTQKGCDLLYRLQQNSNSSPKILKGFKRSYRRGGYFARKHLAYMFERDTPLKILEVGAGDGYFSQGINSYYKKSQITYMDIVEDLLTYYKEHFTCETISSDLKTVMSSGKKFDLIIARDLVEHLINPLDFFKMANAVLEQNGLVFFITPNGREDFWHCNQRFLKRKEALLIYLNHFNYFLPETLDLILAKTGFAKVKAFKFGLKRYRQGCGHQEIHNFDEQVLPDQEQGFLHTKPINECFKHDFKKIVSSFLHGNTFVAKIYSMLADREKEIVDYFAPMGHEFFVIARKIK